MKRAEIEAAYPLRTAVNVVPNRYSGGDFFRGVYYVVGYCGDAKADAYVDLMIARHPDDDYEGIVHLQRIEGSTFCRRIGEVTP